ncbi:MAG TPA: hypothetical protein VN721_02770 [Flavipsychrobacter sp.]|nr:hypothetical protein [Flavipsychrobacter sp.]
MKNKLTTYSPFAKFLCLALAIFIIIFSSAVKKLIELRLVRENISISAQYSSHKLRTGYRERRFTAPTIHITPQATSDADHLLLFASSFALSILFFRNELFSKFFHRNSDITSLVPLYLYCRKLQI